jgi:DNA-binding cell septation regulator SpoVG
MSRPNPRLQTLIFPEANHPVEVDNAEELQAVVVQAHSRTPEQKKEIAVRRRQ